MPRIKTPSWNDHKSKWSNCQDCVLCDRRKHVVLGRGQLPCDLLLVGEAPGVSENVLGRPFVGPAGKLLDMIVEDAGINASIFYTNLVACIPLDEAGSKAKEPSKDSIKACAPRLDQLVRIARPKGIMLVGKLAAKHFKTTSPVLVREMLHPAAIIRLDISQRGLAIQRCIVALKDIVEEING